MVVAAALRGKTKPKKFMGCVVRDGGGVAEPEYNYAIRIHNDLCCSVKLLGIKDNGVYTLDSEQMVANRLPDGCHSIVENSIEENSKEKGSKKKDSPKRFVPPSLEEVQAYCSERGNGIDAQSFIDFYASKGWMVGKTKMTDWKAAVRTWESRKRKQSRPAYSTTDYGNPEDIF